jgi:hypothetical protein
MNSAENSTQTNEQFGARLGLHIQKFMVVKHFLEKLS